MLTYLLDSTSPSPKLQPHEELMLLDRAEKHNDLVCLLPFRKLLFHYQRIALERNDMVTFRRIATIGSHRAGNHLFCGDKCATVEAFITSHVQPPFAHHHLEVESQDESTVQDSLRNGA